MKPQRPSDKEILQAYLNLQIHKIITVPCSITDTWHELVAEAADRGDVDLLATTHEGNLAGIAAGVYFATGRPELVHFQNSGLCNAGDGFVSFAHPRMFAIPMAVLITERGIAESLPLSPLYEILANVIETLPDPPGTFCYPRVKAPGSGEKNLATLTRRFRTWSTTQSIILQQNSFSTNLDSNHHDT